MLSAIKINAEPWQRQTDISINRGRTQVVTQCRLGRVQSHDIKELWGLSSAGWTVVPSELVCQVK